MCMVSNDQREVEDCSLELETSESPSAVQVNSHIHWEQMRVIMWGWLIVDSRYTVCILHY